MSYSPDYSLKLASERRKDDRLPVALAGEVLEIGGARLPVGIRDLSPQGAMFESDHRWKVGARIWLFFPAGLNMNAKVMWTNGARHGCQFLRRLGDEEMAQARASG